MELQALAPLVGTWTTEAVLPGIDAGVTGRTSFAWLDGGGYLVQHAAMDDPAFPTGVMVLGPDSDGGRFLQHYFDSRGVARTYELTLADGLWRLERDGPDFAQRFEGRFSGDGARIEGTWEKDVGDGWVNDFDLRYEREG